MHLEPIGNAMIIRPYKRDNKSAGGILIPDQAVETKVARGVVIAVGPGLFHVENERKGERMPMSCAPGDEVLFLRFAGLEIELEGENHVALKETEVLAIVRP